MTTKLISLPGGKASDLKPDDLIPEILDNYSPESVALILARAVMVLETDRQWSRAALLDAYTECLQAANGDRTAPESTMH